jgi:hypothetical protein
MGRAEDAKLTGSLGDEKELADASRN